MDEDSEDHGGPRNKKSLDGYVLAAALADLSFCCSRLGLHQEAATHCEKSLELKRGYYNFEDDACCSVITNKNLDLAGALEASGNALVECAAYAAAQRRFNEALDMKRLVYGKQHHHPKQQEQRADSPDSSASPTSTTKTPGATSAQSQQAGPALQHMKQQVYGYDRAQNSDVASTLTKLGQLAAIQGRYHMACKRYTEALDMLRAAHEGNEFHVDIAKVLALLGQCNTQAGKRHYAAAYLDQAVSVMQAVITHSYGNSTLERQNHEEVLRQICNTRDACLALLSPTEDSTTSSSGNDNDNQDRPQEEQPRQLQCSS